MTKSKFLIISQSRIKVNNKIADLKKTTTKKTNNQKKQTNKNKYIKKKRLKIKTILSYQIICFLFDKLFLKQNMQIT